MSSNEYLILLSQGKNLKQLQEKFSELEGFYNGIGYVFPSTSEPQLLQIAKALESEILKMPLGKGQTFEAMRLSYKTSFFREKLIKYEHKLLAYRNDFDIEEVSEESIQSSSAPNYKKEKATELLHECERLRKSLEWAEKLEKAANVNTEKSFELQFVSEVSKDYFNKPPPEKERLLYFVENNGNKVTFLHKEIVAMLVGEGGRGKTHLLALLGASVATGVPFLSEIEIEKPGAVCFVVGENNNGDIHRLLFKTYKHIETILKRNSERKDGKHFGLHYQNPLEHFALQFIPFSVHGMNAHFIGKECDTTRFYIQFLEQLKAKEPPEGFQLIILDPASRFSGPDAEKDNAIATSFIACLERISEELKGHPTIILSHHKSKSAIQENSTSQTAARGSSAYTDGSRWQSNLSKGESLEYSVLEVTKTNFTAYPKKLIMKKGKEGIPEFVRWEEDKPINQAAQEKKKKQQDQEEASSSYDISRFKRKLYD